MSTGERSKRRVKIDRLQREIASLSDQQAAAQRNAAIVGMTVEESENYRQRNYRIKELTAQLSRLDSQGLSISKGARDTQQEAEEFTRHGTEGDQASRFQRTGESAD